MCFEKYSPFTRMVLGAISGALLGIFAGLVLSFLISFISTFLMGDAGMMKDGPWQYGISSFFGMGAGAMIGAILGGVYANKK
jgi:hypothetical protein